MVIADCAAYNAALETMKMPGQPGLHFSSSRRRLLLLVLVLFIFTILAFPIFVIRPFTHQDAFALAIALAMLRWAPWLAVAALPSGLFLAFRAWARRGERLWFLKDMFMAAAVVLLAVFAVISRVNIFERMFHPLAEPRFVPVAEAGIDRNDMVMAVRMNGEARAYPVLQMAYHHVLNDAPGGIPIVVTY